MPRVLLERKIIQFLINQGEKWISYRQELILKLEILHSIFLPKQTFLEIKSFISKKPDFKELA